MNRRQFVQTTAAAVPMFGSGCMFFRPGPRYVFPGSIKATCQNRLNIARDRIAQVDGKRPDLEDDCIVRALKGEKFVGGCWCWKYNNKYWVGGLCYLEANGTSIDIGCDPKTGAVHPEILCHEFAHHVLWDISGHKISTHDPRYRAKFTGWMDYGKSRPLSIARPDGRIVLIDVFGEVGE